MKNINIEEIKKGVKVKTGQTVVCFAMLFTLMGCGKVVEDNTATQQPTTSVETVVEPEEDEVTIPGVDQEEDEVTPVEEEKNLPEPTFVQTGANQYTVTVDCPDESNSEALQATYNNYENLVERAGTAGVSPNLICAVIATLSAENNGNLSVENFSQFNDVIVNYHIFGYDMDLTTVITDNPDLYSDPAYVVRDKTSIQAGDWDFITGIYLRDSFINTNYNFTCALERYSVGPAAWEQMMKECIDATGLTAEDIYANYDANFVMSYDTLGLANPEFVNEIVSLISPEDETYVMADNGNGEYAQATYTIERAKTLGSK